jgi:dihydrofolate reductase
MRTLILSEFVTLDGVMEAPSSEPDQPRSGWVIDRASEEQTHYKLEECREAGALLIGRRTYEVFADAWPARDGELADRMNAIPKLVVSTTITDPTWANSTVVNGDLIESVTALKGEPGGPLLCVGSCTVAQALVEHDLVDVYRLMVFPVVLGTGRRLFTQTPDSRALTLADSTTLPSGVAVLTYNRQ